MMRQEFFLEILDNSITFLYNRFRDNAKDF